MDDLTLPMLASLLMAIAGMAFLAREKLYVMMYGPPDLGPVDPQNLTRSDKPNDALAASTDLGIKTQIDIELPSYPCTADQLRSALMKAVSWEADMEPVDHQANQDLSEFSDRFVQRTPAMRYPDTINVHVYRLPDTADGTPQSGLFLYSRSQVGYSDLSTNRKRLDRLLHAIDKALSPN